MKIENFFFFFSNYVDKFVVIWEENVNTSRVLRDELSHSFSNLRNHNNVFLNDIHKHYSARITEIENLYNSKLKAIENTYNAQSNDFDGRFKEVYSYVDNKFDGLQTSSSVPPLPSVSPTVRPSGEVVVRPDVGADVPHAGHPPPEFARLPPKEGVVNSNFTVHGSVCQSCRNIIPANFKGYCPFLTCDVNNNQDEVDDNDMVDDDAEGVVTASGGGNEPSHPYVDPIPVLLQDTADESQASLAFLKEFI